MQNSEGRIMNAQCTMHNAQCTTHNVQCTTQNVFRRGGYHHPENLHKTSVLPKSIICLQALACRRIRQRSTLFSEKLCNNVKTPMKNSSNIIAFSLLKKLAKYGIIFLQLAIIAKKIKTIVKERRNLKYQGEKEKWKQLKTV